MKLGFWFPRVREEGSEGGSHAVADEDHSLLGSNITVVFDDRFEKLGHGIGRVGIPTPGFQLGDAASWEVDRQTRGDRGEAGE